MYRIFVIISLFCWFYQANAQKPVLTIPSEANTESTTFQVTPNNKYILLAYGKSIKVYAVESRKLVNTFLGHSYNVKTIVVAPNNQTVVSTDIVGDVVLWNLYSGKVIRNLSSHLSSDIPISVSHLTLSNNGKDIVVAGINGTIVCLDLLTGKQKYGKRFKPFQITKIDYGYTGKYLLASSGLASIPDTAAKMLLMDAQTGTLVKRVSIPKSLLSSAILSKDEKSIYYVTKNKFEFRKYDIASNGTETEQIFPSGLEPTDILELPDFKLLIACKETRYLTFVIYSLREHKILNIVRTGDIYIPFTNEHLAFFINGNRSVLYVNKGLTNLDINNGSLLKIDLGMKSFSMKVEMSEDHLLFIENKNTLKKWDFKKNELSEVYKNYEEIYSFKEFNSKIILSCKDKVVIWDKNSNNVLKEFPAPSKDYIFDFYANENQNLFAMHYIFTDTLAIYKFEDGSLYKKVKIPMFKKGYGKIKWFGNDLIAYRNYETGESDKLSFYDVNSETTKLITTDIAEAFAKLNDSTIIVAVYDAIKLFNINSGVLIKEVKYEKLANYKSLHYDKKANQIYAAMDNEIVLIDPSTLLVEKTLTGHRDEVIDVKLNENREKVFAVSEAYAVKIWDRKSGVLEGSLSLMDQNDWVVTGKNDLFDASPMAMKKLYYVVNDSTDIEDPYKIIGLDQLKHRYYQPGLLQIQMGYNKEPLRAVPKMDKIDLAPKLKGFLIQDKLQIELKNQRGGIGKIAIFVNNAEIIADARPNGNKDQNLPLLKFAIDLNNYKNRFLNEYEVEIKIIVWNKDGWLSSSPEIFKYRPLQNKGVIVTNATPKKEIEKPRLFAVVFGTADYSGTQIDLRYAGKDAADFASALKNSAQKLFGINDVEINLFNSEATDLLHQPDKKNLISAMEALAKKMKPSDILVVYLSGHGVNFGGADGDFYYLTKEAAGADATYLADPAIRNTAAVSSAELTNLLNKITAKKKMLILDACASGKAAETMLAAARDVPASQVRALDRMQDRTGFYILSGSASDAVSYESSVYGQGLLTYSLLKAMRGAALRIDGGEEYVDIQKLFQYAVDEVPKLAGGIGGIQKPLYRSPDNQQSFDIGKSDEQTKKSIVLAEPKPVFVAVGLQDPNELFDKLSLSEKINAAIRENTAKGKNADFVFTEAKDYPGAYRISGTYEQKDSQLILKYVLIKDKARVGEVRTFASSYKDATTYAADFINELKLNFK